MKWFTDPLFGNGYGTNWKGLLFIAVVGVFLVWSFPWVDAKINGSGDIQRISENGVTCVKPKNASEKRGTAGRKRNDW